ncbi:MAG: response regulator [Bacteroidetes bacterium]|jgi:DNA-binding response OmpR family regulator|nr:response regulator [Bacteroidota bacterium]
MGKNVLVIEDEPIIAEMISIILEIQGLNVISLSDTGRAREKLHGKEVNLVLLDLNLHGEGGQEFCEYIKGQDDLKHIPVILVSANIDIDQIKEECGANDIIRKPFNIDHFMKKVSHYVETVV